MKTAHMCAGDKVRIERLLKRRQLRIAAMMQHNGLNSPGCSGHEQWAWADTGAVVKSSELANRAR